MKSLSKSYICMHYCYYISMLLPRSDIKLHSIILTRNGIRNLSYSRHDICCIVFRLCLACDRLWQGRGWWGGVLLDGVT